VWPEPGWWVLLGQDVGRVRFTLTEVQVVLPGESAGTGALGAIAVVVPVEAARPVDRNVALTGRAVGAWSGVSLSHWWPLGGWPAGVGLGGHSGEYVPDPGGGWSGQAFPAGHVCVGVVRCGDQCRSP